MQELVYNTDMFGDWKLLIFAVMGGLCAEFLAVQILGMLPFFAEQNSQVSICAQERITRGLCAVDFFRVTFGGVVGVIIGYAVCFRIFGVHSPKKTILAYAAGSAAMWVVASAATILDWQWLLGFLATFALFGVEMFAISVVGVAVYFGGKFLLTLMEKKR